MNTGTYRSADDILFAVLPRVDDLEYRRMPKGFYTAMIQKGLQELGMDSFFDERRESFDFPLGNLTLKLPPGCFNVREVYLYNGDQCNIANSVKVWWKRNYYTQGNGYVANDKFNNFLDPFYTNHFGVSARLNKNLIRYNTTQSAKFFYGLQMGNIMFSSFCRGVGNKVMIHYNGIGADIGEVPFIPVFLQAALEDFVTVRALEIMVAKDRNWRDVLAMYKTQMVSPSNPFEGTWPTAITRVKTLNTAQRNDLFVYLGRGSWASGA